MYAGNTDDRPVIHDHPDPPSPTPGRRRGWPLGIPCAIRSTGLRDTSLDVLAYRLVLAGMTTLRS
jgi:hypothetical protein